MKKLYIIGRYINGVTLNPMEYILEGSGPELRTFTLDEALLIADAPSIEAATEKGLYITHNEENCNVDCKKSCPADQQCHRVK